MTTSAPSIAAVDLDPGQPHGRDLGASSCLRILERVRRGRVAALTLEGPLFWPVDMRVDGGGIVVRAGVGRTLDALTAGRTVAVQADRREVDGTVHTVVVLGRPRLVRLAGERDRLDVMPWPRWAPASPYVFARIPMELVFGRSRTR